MSEKKRVIVVGNSKMTEALKAALKGKDSEPVASPQATRPDDRCSYEEPHAAHTWNGRPMIFCPGIPGGPEWRKCTQCRRENSVETWQKHGNKCPNCDDLFDRDAAQPAAGTTPQAERLVLKQPPNCEIHGLPRYWHPVQYVWLCSECVRAVAPVETPEFTEIKPVGSHIIDHPDLKRWLEQEPRYAEQRRDGLWLHYTAICTLLKSYAAQKTTPVETRLTAEQFARTTPEWWTVAIYQGRKADRCDWMCAFAEAFREKSEAGLREELTHWRSAAEQFEALFEDAASRLQEQESK